MTPEKAWEAIKVIGWGTETTDYREAAENLRSLLLEDQIAELFDFCQDRVAEVQAALHKNWLAHELECDGWLSDDGFYDLCCHIVGTGKDSYEKAIVTNQPPPTITHEENFMYIFQPIQA